MTLCETLFMKESCNKLLFVALNHSMLSFALGVGAMQVNGSRRSWTRVCLAFGQPTSLPLPSLFTLSSLSPHSHSQTQHAPHSTSQRIHPTHFGFTVLWSGSRVRAKCGMAS